MTWYAIKWTTLSMVCAAVPRRRWSDCQMGRRNVAIRQDLRLRKIYEYVLAYLSYEWPELGTAWASSRDDSNVF